MINQSVTGRTVVKVRTDNEKRIAVKEVEEEVEGEKEAEEQEKIEMGQRTEDWRWDS